MPSKSFAQARLMAGASHDPVFAKKVGVPMKTAKEFNKADTRSKFLKSAMRARGPAYAEGGEISPAQRSQDFLDRFDAERDREKSRPLPKSTKPAPARSDRRNPDRATITPRTPKPVYEYKGKKYSSYDDFLAAQNIPASDNPYTATITPRTPDEPPRALISPRDVPEPRPSSNTFPRSMTAEERNKLASDNLNYYERPAHLYEAKKPARRGVFDPHERSEDAAFYRKGGTVSKYARGGSVRGAGCETRGLRKAKIY